MNFRFSLVNIAGIPRIGRHWAENPNVEVTVGLGPMPSDASEFPVEFLYLFVVIDAQHSPYTQHKPSKNRNSSSELQPPPLHQATKDPSGRALDSVR